MGINILIGCFVITVKKIVHNVMKFSKMEEKEEKKERKKEGWCVLVGRGNIHQINTSVALIVISPPWLLLCHARQAAKRDLSMQS